VDPTAPPLQRDGDIAIVATATSATGGALLLDRVVGNAGGGAPVGGAGRMVDADLPN